MQFDNQVCTPQQALRIHELGIYSCLSHYCWRRYTKRRYVAEEVWQCTEYGGKFLSAQIWRIRQRTAAWSVAELGVMMPRREDGTGIYYTLQDIGPGEVKGFSCMDSDSNLAREIDGQVIWPTEAQARAALIINLLERRWICPERTNLRLARR